MIFDTLRLHAKELMDHNEVGEDCFILHHCRLETDRFKERYEQNLSLKNPKKKLELPITFYGKVEKTIPGRFQGSNEGNASSYTFKKMGKEAPFPSEWFPWLDSKDEIGVDDFYIWMQKLNDTPPESVCQLFEVKGPLFTFNDSGSDQGQLEIRAAKSVYQPVMCKKPTLAVHSLLALNALNEHAGLFGQRKDPDLIQKELYKFLLLFCMLNKAQSLKILSPDSKTEIRVDPVISASGNIGDISAMPLLLDTGTCCLGKRVDIAESGHPIIAKFQSLTREDEVDRISLTRAQKVFTAPKTGKSPTNSFRMNSQNTMSPEVMLGVDRSTINPFLPAFSDLLQGTSFPLGGTGISYYVFPENVSLTGGYLHYLTDMISQLRSFRQTFDKLKKKENTDKAGEEKKRALENLNNQRKAFWAKSWERFRQGELLYAFEKNVGSSNQKQYAWTSVYRQLPAARAFLLLEMLDNPETFGRLFTLLKDASSSLSEGWSEKEVQKLIDRYFTSGRIEPIEFWIRWRKYLIRRNTAEKPINPALWENAMDLIIQIKAMAAMEVKPEWSGQELLKQLNMRRKTMTEENQETIKAYLTTLFWPGAMQEPQQADEKGMKKVREFIERQAESYAVFVDTKAQGWTVIIDGLVCGWALKHICLKIRSNDYKSVIGGKSLARHTPAQLRSLCIDLHSKAERSGTKPWNVQAPIEQMFKWSQENPHAPKTALFMDAVSLGFMRYDKSEPAGTGSEPVERPTEMQEGDE